MDDRLFSSAVYNDQFEQHTPPEILNTALDGVILVMKAMGIDKVLTPGPLWGRSRQLCLQNFQRE